MFSFEKESAQTLISYYNIQMLFLALCDNVRVNSENLEKARQLLDRFQSPGSSCSWMVHIFAITCEQERGARP